MKHSDWRVQKSTKRDPQSRRSRPDTARLVVVIFMTAAVLLSVGLILYQSVFSKRPSPTGSETGVTTTAPTTGTSSASQTTPSTQPPTSSPTTSTQAPTLPPTRPTHAGDAAYASYDNTSVGWWFRHPVELGKDIPSTVPDDIAALLDTYHAIWRHDTDEKVLYLTMDEGYEYNHNTTQILDVAAAKGIHINFFITGDYITRASDAGPDGTELVLRMRAEGHLVGSHTWGHPNQAELIDAEGVDAMAADMHRLEDAYLSLTGEQIAPFLRPPQGAYSERTLKVLSDLGYRSVMWSFAYRDWITTEQPDPAAALQQIVEELHPGAVYLLHAVSETNVSILSDFIDAAHARGYRFALLDEFP